MECPKCNSKNIAVRLDSRELAEFYCADCDSFIKKAKSSELLEFFMGKLPSGDRPPCKYCTEPYFIRRGRLGTVYTPVDIVYCPKCGREVKESDRSY